MVRGDKFAKSPQQNNKVVLKISPVHAKMWRGALEIPDGILHRGEEWKVDDDLIHFSLEFI